MRLTVTTAPAVEPISVAELKTHLKIIGTDEDADLATYILMAREQAEIFCRRAIITQGLTLRLAKFPNIAQIELPRPPLASVTSLKYYNLSNVLTTVSAQTIYEVINDDLVGSIVLRDGQSWPTDVFIRTDAVEIIYSAGYGVAAAVPASLKMGIRKLASHHKEMAIPYVTGTIVTEVPHNFKHLFWSYRVVTF